MEKINFTLLGLLAIIVCLTNSCATGQHTWLNGTAERHYSPAPPAGKWAAIYTADFAKKFNLPVSGISNTLNNSIVYMEAVSIPAKKLEKFNERYPDQDCAINFLAKKNHDIPLHEAPVFLKNYTDAKRIQYQKTKISDSMKNLDKPLQFSEVNKKYKATYRSISALNAIHSSDLMPEYDYFSLRDLRCRQSLGSLKGNRDIEFNRVVRSSVIDKKAKKSFHTYSETEYREVIIQRDEGGSFLTITVPKTLAKGLYSGVEVPRTPSLITPIQAPLSIAALPFIVAAASTAPTASKEPHNIALPPVWPKGTPSHFKLTRD